MKRPFVTAILILILARPASAAAVRSLSDFDVRTVHGPADQLALCDLTAFLNTAPNLQSDVVIVPSRGGGPARVMRHPFYRPLTPALFDEHLEAAMGVLEARHQLTRREVAEARTRYDAAMLASYEHASLGERAFLREQARRCAQLFHAH